MRFPPATGVLLVAHGTVENLDDLPAFVTRIRHGRPAPAPFLAELRQRYERIGGSPLLRTTREQAAALESALGIPVLVGMRLWEPSVEFALEEAQARGLERLIVIALAPFSQHVYWDAARASRQAVGSPIELIRTDAWGEAPAFVAAHAALIENALAGSPAELVLSAHSLPNVVISRGDPYARLVQESVAAIARKLGRDCQLCYQSQGEGGGDWLGPNVREVLQAASARGARRVVWSPVGFLADHVETLFDLDVEARDIARELGLGFDRVPALNLHPGLIEALAALSRGALSAPST